ncbi:hypothetical protein B0A52_06237 [Exophiala mesophila]|uniref:Uncharacterized protein n=1 Tax=Exophiala mesophila TaxID=212818 RepID=A0A438N347_EXOME|nr:hypothetical protein B0A52_06237 [Exophiala mesophila]
MRTMPVTRQEWPIRPVPAMSPMDLHWTQDYFMNKEHRLDSQKRHDGHGDDYDEALYNSTVLQLPAHVSEDDLDERVAEDAQGLGLLPFRPTLDIDDITSSVSTITIASDSPNQGPRSIQSQSTPPTSCASSEHRPAIQPSHPSEKPLPGPLTVPHLSDAEKRRRSPFARGFRRMAGFRKRRFTGNSSSTLTSISSDVDTQVSEKPSVNSIPKRTPSDQSSTSSWSHRPSPPPARPSHDDQSTQDREALQRSTECQEILDLRMKQLEEKARFLEYQVFLLSQLHSRRDSAKDRRRVDQDGIIAEHIEKRDHAVEELEARQLEEEMKIQEEHDLEKRAVLFRLRHMEAYCQNPTPPTTPVDATSGRTSVEVPLPERKVTEKDYHNLAQQYRERDAMDTLHKSKINVLRGKQKRAVENLMNRRDLEIEKLERDQQKELAAIDSEYASQEQQLLMALSTRKARLEARWRTQATIQRTRMEKMTGERFAALPDVTVQESDRKDAACKSG